MSFCFRFTPPEGNAVFGVPVEPSGNCRFGREELSNPITEGNAANIVPSIMWKFIPNISDKLFRTILLPFVITAAIGLVLSMAAHIASLFGVILPGGKLVWVLHMGIFVVWFPSIFVANRMASKSTGAEFWNAVLSGCPRWTKSFLYIFVIYSFLIMIFAMIETWGQPPPKGDASPEIIRLFSAGWLVFYSAGLATLYSAYKLGYSGISRTCANGHSVALMAKYCDECGASLPKFP